MKIQFFYSILLSLISTAVPMQASKKAATEPTPEKIALISQKKLKRRKIFAFSLSLGAFPWLFFKIRKTPEKTNTEPIGTSDLDETRPEDETSLSPENASEAVSAEQPLRTHTSRISVGGEVEVVSPKEELSSRSLAKDASAEQGTPASNMELKVPLPLIAPPPVASLKFKASLPETPTSKPPTKKPRKKVQFNDKPIIQKPGTSGIANNLKPKKNKHKRSRSTRRHASLILADGSVHEILIEKPRKKKRHKKKKKAKKPKLTPQDSPLSNE